MRSSDTTRLWQAPLRTYDSCTPRNEDVNTELDNFDASLSADRWPPHGERSNSTISGTDDTTNTNGKTERDGGSGSVNGSIQIDIDDAIELIGMGHFQFEIMCAAGLCFASDAIEILMLSFLAVVLNADWDLSERQMDAVVSIVFAGATAGTLVLGPLADRIGRKPVYLATAMIISVFGIATALAPTIEWFYAIRFIVGFGVGGLAIPFDVFAEFVPTSRRGKHLLPIHFFWTAGTLLTTLLAQWTIGGGDGQAWRWFVVYCAIPCVLSMILGFWFVPESPRWLLTKGRHDEAVAILRHGAEKNGKDGMEVFPTNIIITYDEATSTSDNSWAELLSPKRIKLTMQLCIMWFGLAVLYFGAVLLISSLFSGMHDEHNDSATDDGSAEKSYSFDYNAIFISGSAEAVGLAAAILVIDDWGRVTSQCVLYLLGGAALLMMGLLDDADATSRATMIVLALLVRFCMMGATCITWVFTSELLATDIRATGHCVATTAARIGGFFAPYIVTPGVAPQTIGLIMFSVSLVTAFVPTQLPETKGKALGKALPALNGSTSTRCKRTAILSSSSSRGSL